METKYPNIKVNLINQDGNAFMIINRVRAALKKGGVSEDEIGEFWEQATMADYINLLQVVMSWVSIEEPEPEEEIEYDGDDEDECFDCGEILSECICEWDSDENDEDYQEFDDE